MRKLRIKIKLLYIILGVFSFFAFSFVLPRVTNAGCPGCGCWTDTVCDCGSNTLKTVHFCEGTESACVSYWTSCVYDKVSKRWYCTQECYAWECRGCHTYETFGGSCSCCTPGACGGCTPSCPTGQSTTVSGSLCATGISTCAGSDGCNGCTLTGGSCYLPETNTTFIQSNGSTDGPSSVSMIVDGVTYALSTDSNNPTHIKLPASGSSNVQVSVPAFTAPTTSRGANYYFQANNYGNNDEWKTWTTCSGTDGEDFCTTMPNSNNTQSFTPTSKTVNEVLKENAVGQISAKYATTDKCSDTYKYSVAIEGYYVVDIIPDIPSIIVPEDIFPDITTDVTSKGCSSLTYTGQEINNALHVILSATDTNSNDEIQALTLWFSKDDTVPTTGTITGTYSGSSNQDLGIMIKKNGSDWSNPYIYATNTSPFTFAQLTNEYITVNGSNIARIYDVSVTQSTNVTFDYKIEFLQSAENLSGMYNVYGGVLDSYMINDTIIDQSYFTSLTDWGIDLVNPVVNDITQEVYDPTNTFLTWSVSDTISGIDRTVMNAYRVGGVTTDNVTLYIPTAYTTSKGSISPESLPDTEQIGMYSGTNAWVFTTSTGEKDKVNIGNNEGGNILIYGTGYDKACNYDGESEVVDLNPWFATRGGTVYSANSITATPKDVSSSASLDGVFNPKTFMTKERIDLGTELLATRNVNISNLINSTTGAVRVLEMYDSNNMKNYWYQTFVDSLSRSVINLTKMTNITTSSEEDCTGGNCYYLSTNENTDVHIPNSYVCNKPTVIVSAHDIYIEPNVESGNELSGCIFLAKNNIYIGDGDYLSDTKIKYDYLEGFLIADNQIVFSLSDQAQMLRDGIEVYGGLIAFGSNISDGASAISIERNMRLFNSTNPALVVTYDNKYYNLSLTFFGSFVDLYKQEIGFKSF